MQSGLRSVGFNCSVISEVSNNGGKYGRRRAMLKTRCIPRKGGMFVGRLVVVIDVNPSHGFWTARLIKVFGHEGQCTCIYNTHEWIVYIMLFLVVCGTSRGSSWLRRNEFLKMTK
jgi:hypothetical protein